MAISFPPTPLPHSGSNKPRQGSTATAQKYDRPTNGVQAWAFFQFSPNSDRVRECGADTVSREPPRKYCWYPARFSVGRSRLFPYPFGRSNFTSLVFDPLLGGQTTYENTVAGAGLLFVGSLTEFVIFYTLLHRSPDLEGGSSDRRIKVSDVVLGSKAKVGSYYRIWWKRCGKEKSWFFSRPGRGRNNRRRLWQ